MMWLQHSLVLLLVAVCMAVVGVQALRTLRGRKGKLGSCCTKGCDADASKSSSSRVLFLPADGINITRRSTKG